MAFMSILVTVRRKAITNRREMNVTEDMIADSCHLRYHDSSHSMIATSVIVGPDRVTASTSIPKDEILMVCGPILEWRCLLDEGNVSLLCALKRAVKVDGDDWVEEITERLADIYPRTEDEIRLCLQRYSPGLNADALVSSPYSSCNRVDIKHQHSAIRTGERKYLYHEISKLNHSCRPNCRLEILEKGVGRVWSRHKIKTGVELTIDYLQFCNPDSRLERKNRLISFGFLCHCELCKGRCHACDKLCDDLKLCGRCRVVTYCSVECQKRDWSQHKKIEHNVRHASLIGHGTSTVKK